MIEKANVNPEMVRLYPLKDGDIFTVKDVTVQFEGQKLYEVKDVGLDAFYQTKWERTGKIFTTDQLNEMCR